MNGELSGLVIQHENGILASDLFTRICESIEWDVKMIRHTWVNDELVKEMKTPE